MSELALICLGANVPDARRRLDDAYAFLSGCGSVVRSTPVYPSDAEYSRDVAPYLNRIVELAADMPYTELQALVKSYESGVREAADAYPYVAVDIDIVEWNGTVIKHADAASAYFRKGLGLLHEGS